MTHDEAVKMAKVLMEADGGCSHCIANLADWAKEEFPEHDWYALTGTKPS